MPFISLHSKVLLLPPSILFAWFLLFCNSCIISHLQNFWRARILLINSNNKGRPLWETCRQPFHRLNWRCLGCLYQWRFYFLQPAEKPCALNIILKDSQSKNQVSKIPWQLRGRVQRLLFTTEAHIVSMFCDEYQAVSGKWLFLEVL